MIVILQQAQRGAREHSSRSLDDSLIIAASLFLDHLVDVNAH